MTAEKTELKTIWYFVGLILIAMGSLVFLSGIIQVISPPLKQTVLSDLHPTIWWGAIMILVGLIYFLSNKNKIVD